MKAEHPPSHRDRASVLRSPRDERELAGVMKSSTLYYYFMKTVALVLLAFPFLLLYESVNGHLVNADRSSILFVLWMLAAVVSSPLLAWVIWRQFAIIEFSNDIVEVYRRGRRSSFSWAELAAIRQLPCCTPPVYRITFRTGAPPAYCMFHSLVVASVGFWSWDFSGFMAYARPRLLEATAQRSGRSFPTDAGPSS